MLEPEVRKWSKRVAYLNSERILIDIDKKKKIWKCFLMILIDIESFTKFVLSSHLMVDMVTADNQLC